MPQTVPVPEFISRNAERGLKYRDEGKGGNGLVDATIRAARDMVEGSISEAKLRKMAPWFARHKPDMEAPANDPDNDAFPGNGAVAWLLWGGSVSGDKMDAAKWAERTVERLDREREEAAKLDSLPRVETDMDTIESKLASAESALVALTAERDDLRVSFEKLAAEKTEAVNAVSADIAAKDAKLAELTAAVDGLTAERAELVAKIAALEAGKVTASAEAAKIAASVGVAPVESAPEASAAPKLSVLEQYLALSGTERAAFYASNKAAIHAAMRG